MKDAFRFGAGGRGFWLRPGGKNAARISPTPTPHTARPLGFVGNEADACPNPYGCLIVLGREARRRCHRS